MNDNDRITNNVFVRRPHFSPAVFGHSCPSYINKYIHICISASSHARTHAIYLFSCTYYAFARKTQKCSLSLSIDNRPVHRSAGAAANSLSLALALGREPTACCGIVAPFFSCTCVVLVDLQSNFFATSYHMHMHMHFVLILKESILTSSSWS